MILETERDETFTINAIKVLAAPTDNDLNTTTLYPYLGFYNSTTKVFTPLKPIDEEILNEEKYKILDLQAHALIISEHEAGNVLTPFKAQKKVMYDYLSALVGETNYTVI